MAKSEPDGVLSLRNERARSTLNVEKLSQAIYGEQLPKFRRVNAIVESEPLFRNFLRQRQFFGREELFKRAMAVAARTLTVIEEQRLDVEEQHWLYDALDPGPIGLHRGMFLPTLRGQMSDEQQAKWLPLALNYKILGCYAQTELGHGSNVRGLETTATFDRATDEFVLHSPSITAWKWWPGNLGKTSTHCVTHARMIIDGKDYGVNTFIVQLRDLRTHEVLPGITLGDIGPKFGYREVDNGYMAFDHHRVPRDHLLMRYTKVDRDGNYTEPVHSKIHYATMMGVRAHIINGAGHALSKAVTICIRYSAVRRQFGPDGEREVQVLDYQPQQYALFPLLATALAFRFTGRKMFATHQDLMARLTAGDVSTLAEVHATSCGLKAFTTWITSRGIDECRQKCGGHGYSHMAGLPQLFQTYTPACTYEGDNVVMSLQTARFLMKAVGMARKGQRLPAGVQYLESSAAPGPCAAKGEEFLDPAVQLQLYRRRAQFVVTDTAQRMAAIVASGRSAEEAWNSVSADLVRAVKAHVFYTMVVNFTEAISTVDPSLRTVIKRLSDLFSLFYLEQDIGDFLEDGQINRAQARDVRGLVRSLLAQVRPDAVSLVDAFSHSDVILQSALGRKDGNVYEDMVKWAQEDPFNRLSVPAGFHESLAPVIKRGVTHIQARL